MSFTPMGTLGGDIWEWWHAETVQREYEAVGKEAPSIEDIESGAREDAVRAAGEEIKKVGVGLGLGATVLFGAALLFLAVRK
jgi:hypothetical protein